MCNGCATCVAAATTAAQNNAVSLQAAKTNHGRATHGTDPGGQAKRNANNLQANTQAVYDNIYTQTLNRLKRTCRNP